MVDHFVIHGVGGTQELLLKVDSSWKNARVEKDLRCDRFALNKKAIEAIKFQG